MNQPLLSAQKISVCFGKRQILDNIDLDIYRNQIITIIGPNGSGKTSLIRVLLNIINPDQGKVVKDNNINIGYMPQKLVIDRIMPLTVRRFLRLRANSRRLRDIETVEAIANELKIIHLMKTQIHDISGGEMQRVMLARALLLEPNLLVLDEPTQGLDLDGQTEMYQLLSNIRDKRSCAILMVSHDLHLVMAATDHVVCLNNHICCQGKPDDVKNDKRFLNLFSKENAINIATYTHLHDHKH